MSTQNAHKLKSGKAKGKVLVLLFVVAGVLYFSPGGWFAVHDACETDGGYRINSTVFTNGYLLDDGSSSVCSTCISDVANGVFDYVDVERRHFNVDDDLVQVYDRYSVSTRGDPACNRVEHNTILNRIARSTALKSTDCIAINAMTTSSDYVFRYESRRLRSWFGVSYYLDQYTITQDNAAEPLATFRRYWHLPLLHKIIDRYAKPMWTCDEESPAFDPVAFRMKVLRDSNRMVE